MARYVFSDALHAHGETVNVGSGLLRNSSLVALLVAEVVSFTGLSMTFVALPWFVLATTGSTSHMAWILAADVLPAVLLGIPLGSVIARLGPKRIMNIADAVRAPLLVLIPVLYWMGHLTFPTLLVIAMLIGCFSAPYFPSSQIILPEVVGEHETLVAQASAFVQGGNQVTGIIGPILAGMLIAWHGAPMVLIFNGITYLFSFVVILFFVRIKRHVVPTAEEARGILAGLRFVFREPFLRALCFASPGIQIADQALFISLPVLVFRRYHQDPHIVGVLFSGIGGGALIGSILMGRLAMQQRSLGRLASFAIIAASLPLWLLVVPMPWPVVALVLAASSVFLPLTFIPINTILMLRIPQAVRPKVLTAMMTLGSMAGPLGIVGFGQVLAYVPLNWVYAIIAALFSGGAIAISLAFRHNNPIPATNSG